MRCLRGGIVVVVVVVKSTAASRESRYYWARPFDCSQVEFLIMEGELGRSLRLYMLPSARMTVLEDQAGSSS